EAKAQRTAVVVVDIARAHREVTGIAGRADDRDLAIRRGRCQRERARFPGAELQGIIEDGRQNEINHPAGGSAFEGRAGWQTVIALDTAVVYGARFKPRTTSIA